MIYLLRHGETVWNRQDRLQGQRDAPLTRTGIAQVEANARLLRQHIDDPHAFEVIASPLGRAWQSAAIIAEILGKDPDRIVLEPRLVEISFGDWEGLTLAELERAVPGAWARRRADHWRFRPPGAESFADVAERVAPWLAQFDDSARLIVVCHGGTGRVIRGLYAGLAPEVAVVQSEEQTEVFRLANTRIETLASDPVAAVP